MVKRQDDAATRKGALLAAAAASFIGTPFRLHGRDPGKGLDCVGLVWVSLRAIGERPVHIGGYKLRNAEISPWLDCAERSGFARVDVAIEPGDLLLIRPGPGQHHLVIAESGDRAIHAHAGLRSVVRQPFAFPCPHLAHWRLT